MGQALRHPKYFTVEEQKLGTRHEFVNGVMFAMVGGTATHNLIANNGLIHLARALPLECEVFTQGVKERVATDIGEAQYYPDVFVSCDPGDREPLFRQRPCLIIEVLSPSIESDDRLGKFELYRTIPSLERRRRRCLWRKGPVARR